MSKKIIDEIERKIKKQMAELSVTALTKKDNTDKTQCMTCKYREKENGPLKNACIYAYLVGAARPCEPSPNCTAYKREERRNDTKRIRRGFLCYDRDRIVES